MHTPGTFTIRTDELGQWGVYAEWYGQERNVFSPENNDAWMDLQDCLLYVKRDGDMPVNVASKAVWKEISSTP